MNESKTITLTISPKGETKIETHGFSGSTCKDASKFIETALGQTTAEQLKSDYFVNNNHTQQEYENQ